MKKTTAMVLVMAALMGRVRAQDTFKQADQVCAYVQAALPWLIYGHVEIISDPLVVDVTGPPWLRYGGILTIRSPLGQLDLQVSRDWR